MFKLGFKILWKCVTESDLSCPGRDWVPYKIPQNNMSIVQKYNIKLKMENNINQDECCMLHLFCYTAGLACSWERNWTAESIITGLQQQSGWQDFPLHCQILSLRSFSAENLGNIWPEISLLAHLLCYDAWNKNLAICVHWAAVCRSGSAIILNMQTLELASPYET